MFHPIKLWWRRGPFTPLFRAFLRSNIKGASKFTIMAYIGTYCTLFFICFANFRCYGEYMDMCSCQLLCRRLVRSIYWSILYGLFQYLDYSFLCLHNLRSSLQRHSSISM